MIIYKMNGEAKQCHSLTTSQLERTSHHHHRSSVDNKYHIQQQQRRRLSKDNALFLQTLGLQLKS